jgi:uncharacterized membrane protein YeaQ/YmgE (transglycosylase-associated protein family)
MMLEHIAQMAPMLALAGLTAAWIAEAVSRAGGYGFTWDMALGLTGSVLAGVAVWVALTGGAGMATMFLIGCGGAALLILAQRRVWRHAGVGA